MISMKHRPYSEACNRLIDQEVLALYWSRIRRPSSKFNVHHHVHKNASFEHNVTELNPVHALSPITLPLSDLAYFNSILPSSLHLRSRIFPSDFKTKIVYAMPRKDV